MSALRVMILLILICVAAVEAGEHKNRTPYASAGYPHKLVVNTELPLKWIGMDPDGDNIEHVWTIAQQPDGSKSVIRTLSNGMETVYLGAPGKYVLTLIVSDAYSSASDDVTITVVGSDNSLPADPGALDQESFLGSDSNTNGIRDDVERYIHANYGEHPRLLRALGQFAHSLRVLQISSMRDPDTSTALEGVVRAESCLNYVEPDSQIKTEAAVSVAAEMSNTMDRFSLILDTQYELGYEISGSSIPAPNGTLPNKTNCDFQI